MGGFTVNGCGTGDSFYPKLNLGNHFCKICNSIQEFDLMEVKRKVKVLYTTYQKTMDVDAIYEQLLMTLDNPTRLLEIQRDHPAFARRVFCSKEFEQCEVLYSWRPDIRKPGTRVHKKDETDAKCKKLVSFYKNK